MKPLAFLFSAATIFLLSSAVQATTLDEAIAAARKHAPEVDAADAELSAAEARLDQARAGGRPTATLSGTIGIGYLDPQGYFGLSADNVTPRAAQLVIEQPLFTGGRVSSAIAQARAGINAAEASQTGTNAMLATNVVTAYGNILATRRMVEHYGRLATETVEIERQAQVRFRVGESPRTDVSQAQARNAEARAALARSEAQLISAKAHFRSLTGLDGENLEPLPANPEMPVTLDEALALAAERNPALLQAQAALQAARAAAQGANADRLPMISAFAEGASVRDQFFPGYSADSATVGMRARWQFYSGGRVSGRVTETSAQVRAAEARLRGAQLSIEEAIIASFHNVRTTQLVEQAAADQFRAAEDALASVRQEVRVGMKPQLDLLDAEREAIAAAAALEQARTDRVATAYRLRALVGQE